MIIVSVSQDSSARAPISMTVLTKNISLQAFHRMCKQDRFRCHSCHCSYAKILVGKKKSQHCPLALCHEERKIYHILKRRFLNVLENDMSISALSFCALLEMITLHRLNVGMNMAFIKRVHVRNKFLSSCCR